jgi:hypothetical protein
VGVIWLTGGQAAGIGGFFGQTLIELNFLPTS